MVSGRKGTGRFLGSQDCANRHAAAQRLGSGHDIGRNTVMLISKKLSGAAHSSLNLINNHQDTQLVTNRPYLAYIFRSKGKHAAFSLNQLQHHGAGFAVYRLAKGLKITGSHVDESRRQRGIGLLILCLCGSRALVGLSAGIGKKYPAGKCALGQHPGQARLRLNIVEVGGMQDSRFDLVDQLLRIGGIRIAQDVDGNPAKEINILLPLAVSQRSALCFDE